MPWDGGLTEEIVTKWSSMHRGIQPPPLEYKGGYYYYNSTVTHLQFGAKPN